MAKVLNRIKIDKIGYGGIGLARMSDGKRILIKWGALPGSVVDLRIVKQKKDYVEAHITHIQSLDPTIVDGEVFCPHFFHLGTGEEGTNISEPQNVGCGGCKWQMLSYTNQLKLKEAIVNDACTKIKKKLPDLEVTSIIWSPEEKKYRNKIEFSFGKYITTIKTENLEGEKDVKKQLSVLSDRSCGFHKQGEFSKIINIHNCALISDEANLLFTHLTDLCKSSGLPVHDQVTHKWFFRHLVIRQGTNTDQFLVNLSVADGFLTDETQSQRDALLATITADTFLQEKITSFVITSNNGLADTVKSQETKTRTLRWAGHIYEKLIFKKEDETAGSTVDKNTERDNETNTEISFRVSPFSFFQTNTLWAQQLFGQAMKMVGNIQGTVLDLYCGTGSIGISFLKSGKGENLVGIEIVEEAITDARHNAKINGIEDKVTFLANPAEKAFTTNPEIKDKLHNLGLVIIDPPRDGLHKNVVEMICDLKKASDFKLLYISCNPVTMVRDIELLIAWGFSIKEIQPVDMFPQTHHIECIWVLT